MKLQHNIANGAGRHHESAAFFLGNGSAGSPGNKSPVTGRNSGCRPVGVDDLSGGQLTVKAGFRRGGIDDNQNLFTVRASDISQRISIFLGINKLNFSLAL